MGVLSLVIVSLLRLTVGGEEVCPSLVFLFCLGRCQVSVFKPVLSHFCGINVIGVKFPLQRQVHGSGPLRVLVNEIRGVNHNSPDVENVNFVQCFDPTRSCSGTVQNECMVANYNDKMHNTIT